MCAAILFGNNERENGRVAAGVQGGKQFGGVGGNLRHLVLNAVVAPLNSATKQITEDSYKNLKIFFREYRGCEHYLRIKTPKISTYISDRYDFFRLYITDTLGNPVKNIPYFEFRYRQKGGNPPIIESYPIANEFEDHPYEIIRRVKYLQDNAANLRYTVDPIKYDEDE